MLICVLPEMQCRDESRGIYANRFLNNDSLSAKVGPTSFFPMQSGAATVAQAEAMVTGWLSNRSRFCVSADWPFAVCDGLLARTHAGQPRQDSQ